jgi:hypothetical protein
MSLFSDVDFSEGTDNPFGLTKGTHAVTISDAKVSRSEVGNLGLWLTFTGDGKKSIRKWITLPEKTQDAETRARNTSFLRMILKNLGIPEFDAEGKNIWKALESSHFIGIECTIIVVPQPNSEYFQVKKIMAKGTVPNTNGPTDWTPPSSPTGNAEAQFSGKGGF